MKVIFGLSVLAALLAMALGIDVPMAVAAPCAAVKGSTMPVAGCGGKPASGTKAVTNSPVPDNFRDVVAYALDVNPQIAYARAQLAEAKAGIAVAESNNGVQVDVSAGGGYGAQGTNSAPLDVGLLQDPNFSRAKRYIGSLSSKKLLYDFGSTNTSILRANTLTDAQKLALEAKVDDIGFAIADAYIHVFETRELSKLDAENIAALEKIQALVQANDANGNGTLADVKRVEARLVDARSVSADTEAELQNAIDAFRRLVKSDPGDLKEAPDLAPFAPPNAAKAIEILRQTSAHLRSIRETVKAANLELEAKKAGQKPQIIFETDTTLKTYAAPDWNNLDAQAIISLNYKFMDGGLAQGQYGQILARIDQAEQLFTNDRDQAEADLRKYYTTIEAARSKTQSLEEGVAASASARDLYSEQFSAGRRTLFELLDIQTSYFNAKRSAILNMFEERRSFYSVLQTLGLFVAAANGDRHPLVVASYMPEPSAPDVKPAAKGKRSASSMAKARATKAAGSKASAGKAQDVKPSDAQPAAPAP